MPYELALPKRLRTRGWKVKIRDKERVEPPHVTVMHREYEWRIGLRDQQPMMPPGGRLNDIDPEVIRIIEENWDVLIGAWDAKYPENPVSSLEDEDGEGA